MQGWMAPLVGLSLGLSVVAAGAALVLPEKPLFDLAPLMKRVLSPARPMVAPEVVPQVVPPVAAVPAAPRSVPPAVAAAPRATPAPRPVPPPPVAPDPPVGIEGLLRPRPAGWSNGTGFFVTSRGTILTAEHVVRGCRGVRVMSGYMRPEDARVLAMDAANDVAVLEVAGLTSPAWLPVAPPSRQASRLFVLGFPAGSLPDTPNETWARLSNDAFEGRVRAETDPSRLVWFRSRDVTFGYSGGPVVDVASGRVVAMSKAVFDSRRVSDIAGVSTDGLAIGPGAVPMLALLSQWAVREGVVPVVMGVEAALELARQATVRVVCTR